MKKLLIPAGILLLAGIVMVLLPIHMGMTGLILLLLGAALGLVALLYDRAGDRKGALWALLMLASVGVTMLMACMNLISDYASTDWAQARESEYAIVLGAGVQADGSPSRIMRQRLRAAMEFMQENPHARVILSGGQGRDEPVTEARCMYDALLDMGAPSDRLLLEEESQNTRENFQNSVGMIDRMGLPRDPKKPIAVITSEFHQRRAAYISEKLGIATTPVSSHTDQWFYRVNYTLREVFAMVKAMVLRGD